MSILDKNGNKIESLAASSRVRPVNDNQIINKITTQFQDRSRKDIQKWRTAIMVAQSVEKPRRDLLINLYNDLLTDGHLYSQMELRKAATLNTPFQVIDKKTGEINNEMTSFFNHKWFYDLLSDILETLFYGHTLIEIESFEDNKVNYSLIPRQNVVPNKKQIIPDLSNPNKIINYSEKQYEGWLIEVGKSKDLGILNAIIPNLIWKRNAIQSWAEFCERFGIPLMTATTLKQDEATLDLVEGMLSELGEASSAVFPQGTTIDIKEANRADAYKVFDAKIARNNEEISKAIVGGTMVSDGGSSKSQSEVHERGLENRLSVKDKRYITFLINDDLMPILRQRGYDVSDNDCFKFSFKNEMNIMEHFEVVNDVINSGHEVDLAWVSKTFNVPITGKRPVALVPIKATAIKKQESLLLDDDAIKKAKKNGFRPVMKNDIN